MKTMNAANNRKYNLAKRLDDLRTQLGVTTEQMRTETLSLMGLFKANGMRDKFLGLVPLKLIRCDNTYQVPQLVNPAIVENIAANYDPRIMEPVKLCVRTYEGSQPGFWLPDGRHRTLAMLERGEEFIIADVFEVTSPEDEVTVFIDQYRNKNRLKPYGRFNAQCLLGDSAALAVREVCDKYGLKIPAARRVGVVNQVTCVGTLVDLGHTLGKDGLEFIFSVLYESYADTEKEAYTSDMICAVAYCYRHFGAECYGTLVSILKGHAVTILKAEARSHFKEKKSREALNTYLAYRIDDANSKVTQMREAV